MNYRSRFRSVFGGENSARCSGCEPRAPCASSAPRLSFSSDAFLYYIHSLHGASSGEERKLGARRVEDGARRGNKKAQRTAERKRLAMKVHNLFASPYPLQAVIAFFSAPDVLRSEEEKERERALLRKNKADA